MIKGLAYHGGKSRLAKIITSIIDSVETQCYIEPYLGGGSILAAKKKHQNEIANDSSYIVYNFFYCLQKYRIELQTQLLETPYHEYYFDKFLRLTKDFDPENSSKQYKIDLAIAFFITTQISFARKGGNIAFSTEEPVVQLLENKIESLSLLSLRLKNVQYSCRNALDIIEAHAARENVIFYFDPPYPDTIPGQHYAIKEKVEIQEHFEKLKEAIAGIRGKWILSCAAPNVTENWVKSVGAEMFVVPLKTTKNTRFNKPESYLNIREEAIITNIPNAGQFVILPNSSKPTEE